jgi:hypothetical protein
MNAARFMVAVCVVVTCATEAFAEGVAFSLRDAASAPAAFDGAEAPSWNYQDTEAPVDEPLSPSKAVLWSLLLPGLGDWKMGHRDRATVFFGIEGIIWASFVSFEIQGRDLEDQYQSLAVLFAGVTTTDHSDDFYATIRDYDNSDEYEADIKNDGRVELLNSLGEDALDQIGSGYLDQYFTDNRVADYEPWLWASTDRRLQYSEYRSASKTAYRRADYMIAAAAANRVVSAIFAYAAARSLAKHDVGMDFDLSPRGDMALALTKSF